MPEEQRKQAKKMMEKMLQLPEDKLEKVLFFMYGVAAAGAQEEQKEG